MSVEEAVSELIELNERVSRKIAVGESVRGEGNFVLKKEATDFLRIDCDRPGEVIFSGNWLSDRDGRGAVARVFGNIACMGFLRFRTSIERGARVIGDYYEESRDVFESYYEAGYVERQSSYAVRIT